MAIKTKTPLQRYMELPEGYPAELMEGEIVVVPSPSADHQRILGKIVRDLVDFVEKHDLGVVFPEMDVRVDDENVIRPDISFVSKESVKRVRKNWIEKTPDLVVEILSPSTVVRDLTVKKDLYEKSGVREYWIVDLENEEVYVYFNEGGRFKLVCHGKRCTSKILKGFSWGFEG